MENKCAYEYRKNLGSELAKETDIKADFVVPVPDSGVPAALGYSEKSKKHLIWFNTKSLRRKNIYRAISKYKKFRCKIKIKFNKDNCQK